MMLYGRIAAAASLMWDRLTLTRLTTVYFIFSVAHCFVQVTLQSEALHINAHAAAFLSNLASKADTLFDGRKTIPDLHSNFLRICPAELLNNKSEFDKECTVVWNATDAAPTSSSAAPHSHTTAVTAITSSTSSLAATLASTSSSSHPSTSATSDSKPEEDDADESDDEDDLEHSDDEDSDDEEEHEKDHKRRNMRRYDDSIVVTLSQKCLHSLQYPANVLDNTKREDIAFIGFQFWVLGMSIVAILNESIPHTIASCLTHLMSMVWSSIQIVHTRHFEEDFHRAVIYGACEGKSLIEGYWRPRHITEAVGLAFNAIALIISVWLSWRIVKTFGWQTFKRLGASRVINRVYHTILALSVILQLSFFFMSVMLILWLDSLFNGIASEVADYAVLYKTAAFISILLLLVWLYCGWVGVRTERRVFMFIFLQLSLLYLGGWGVMFYSDTFRFIFLNWAFFCVMASASAALTVLTFVLGVFCRFNFGKGLPEYLARSQEGPSEADRFSAFDDEKFDFVAPPKPEERIEFPKRRFNLKTFSIAFPTRARTPTLPVFKKSKVSPIPPPATFVQLPPPAAASMAPRSRPSSGSSGSFRLSYDRPPSVERRQDLPLARPGFKELVLRSDTTSTGYTDWSRRS